MDPALGLICKRVMPRTLFSFFRVAFSEEENLGTIIVRLKRKFWEKQRNKGLILNTRKIASRGKESGEI
jgi:hypothetical protein